MKKYSILALALALCVTGLTGCRRNTPLATTAPTTMPTTAATTAPTTHATTEPATRATTEATTIPSTTENGPMEDNAGTAPSGKARSHTHTPGMG